MAVKKDDLVQDNRNQLDLETLLRYIQIINEQPNYISSPSDLIKNCEHIVKCLARISTDDKQLWEVVQTVELFLQAVTDAVNSDVRQELITAIVDKMYSYISDPQSDVPAATCIVLIILDEENFDSTIAAARWLVQKEDNGPAGAGLRAALTCLYRWMYEWQGTPALGQWVLAYIKALEENECFEVLIEVSVDNLVRLFLAVEDATSRPQSVTDVIFHVLASLRKSIDALDKISPNVGKVLYTLAADSGQWSRQLLQNVVDITKAMVDGHQQHLKGHAKQLFRSKYANIFSCLERHMASRDCRFLQLPPWRPRNVCLPKANPNPPLRKVGLLNLGNTCYMNSVMQALFLTRQFSTHVMLSMSGAPYWSKMGILFATMMHSITNKLDPNEFFGVVKPPFFTRDHQHDSSEFLGYLFELLQSYEHVSEKNFDYSRPPVLIGHSRMRAIAQNSNGTSSNSSSDIEPESSPNRRSMSPRPSSSNGSTSGSKRSQQDCEQKMPPRKRMRMGHEFTSFDSFIDSTFGGILLTRVECTDCRSSYLSRDVFRDLQLAFPEKPQNPQHSVQGLLEFYCSKERLSGDNRYDCHECGGLRDAERSVLIETTPKYLILVLKNFKFEPKMQVQTKLMLPTYHNYEVVLPTVRSQAEHSSYWLYAAVVHAGTTLDSGHYYTVGKENDDWYLYNDDKVSLSVDFDVNKLNRCSTPYILFYKRNDVEEGAVPSLQELPPSLREAVLAHNKHYVEKVRKARLTRQ